MTTKLVEVLARVDAGLLKPLLGEATLALLLVTSPGAGNQRGFAELIVSQYSPAGSLRTPAILKVLLAALQREEAAELCELLGLPTADPSNTLNGVRFELNGDAAKTLLSWFVVDYDDSRIAAPLEISRRVEPGDKLRAHQLEGYRTLRARIADNSAKVLVHMPFGAGKLRLVATTLVDLFRSEPEGRLLVWLALGERPCEDAFDELVQRWRDLGSRAITAYRLYGSSPLPDLSNIHSGIVVADVAKLLDRGAALPDELRALGSRTRVVVLGDATHALRSSFGEAIELMLEGGNFSLVGLCGVSAGFLEQEGIADDLRGIYSLPDLRIEDVDPIGFLRTLGDVGTLESEVIRSSVPKDGADENDCDLEQGPPDRLLIERLVSETAGGQKAVFFAESADQARMFVGILGLQARPAVAVTGSMPPEQRTQQISRFNNRPNTMVLCVHDVFVPGSEVPNVAVVLFAASGLSSAVFGTMISRLASGRPPGAMPLKIIAVTRSTEVFGGLTMHLDQWKNLETRK